MSGHAFVRPGQVAPDRPAPDACMRCGLPEVSHADLRVTSAREFLAGARKRKVGELPPSLLMREDAELRRQLGQVLDALGQGAVIDDGQREVLASALSDALDWRQPWGLCPDCEKHPAGLCQDHSADLDLCDAYEALGRELGIEVDR